MTHFVEHYGLWVVLIVVFLEVVGLPFIPGETALITAAVLASQGHGSIVYTIAVAIAAAVLGAGVAYEIGHRWGRELLGAWPWFERVSKPAVDRSESFFDDHGSKAVFLGRFLPILRATLGWMAGVARMKRLPFLLWNVTGGVAWGVAIGLLAFYGGKAAANAVQRYGLYAVVVIAVLLGGGFLVLRPGKRRLKTK